MKTCASPSCSASVVSLAAALKAGWKFLAGRLLCGRCHHEERPTWEPTR